MSKYGIQTHGTSPLLLRGGGIAKRGTGQALKSGGRAGFRFGSVGGTDRPKQLGMAGGGRTNLLEELGRVEAERSNPNRRAEISRVHGELNKGYKTGGRVGLKKGGSDKNWMQKATKGMRKDKPCTGKKFGSKSCPPGSKRYNLAKTFKKMGKARKG